ncbi:integrase [Micromonospora sp. NPDC007271]|uniref:integrase n=1 Tax=Micromonospora sp. NPDC007271 TaxID=3154587 RepID=UPI0033E50110
MRSRLRKLHIDGREFTWKADIRTAPGPDGRLHRCIRIRAWGAGKNGRALQLDLTERPSAPAIAQGYQYIETDVHGSGETYPFPTAEDVGALVRYAQKTGWTPDALGGTFRITSAADLALPEFAITDLLWAAERHH